MGDRYTADRRAVPLTPRRAVSRRRSCPPASALLLISPLRSLLYDVSARNEPTIFSARHACVAGYVRAFFISGTSSMYDVRGWVRRPVVVCVSAAGRLLCCTLPAVVRPHPRVLTT